MKILCAGDGGMIYLKSQELVNTAKEQLYYGLPNKQKSGMDSSVAGNRNWWEFEINRPGRRAIMNNIAYVHQNQTFMTLKNIIPATKNANDINAFRGILASR